MRGAGARAAAVTPLLGALWLLGCGPRRSEAPVEAPTGRADVIAVHSEGEPGAWTFAVTVRSPDQGCARYAAFWEVVDPEGQTLHLRRILAHSHVDEQPFTRQGGPVAVAADQEVVVRAWMHPDGYGGQALRGTVGGGFRPWSPPEGFGAALRAEGPQVEFCAF